MSEKWLKLTETLFDLITSCEDRDLVVALNDAVEDYTRTYERSIRQGPQRLRELYELLEEATWFALTETEDSGTTNQ